MNDMLMLPPPPRQQRQRNNHRPHAQQQQQNRDRPKPNHTNKQNHLQRHRRNNTNHQKKKSGMLLASGDSLAMLQSSSSEEEENEEPSNKITSGTSTSILMNLDNNLPLRHSQPSKRGGRTIINKAATRGKKKQLSSKTVAVVSRKTNRNHKSSLASSVAEAVSHKRDGPRLLTHQSSSNKKRTMGRRHQPAKFNNKKNEKTSSLLLGQRRRPRQTRDGSTSSINDCGDKNNNSENLGKVQVSLERITLLDDGNNNDHDETNSNGGGGYPCVRRQQKPHSAGCGEADTDTLLNKKNNKNKKVTTTTATTTTAINSSLAVASAPVANKQKKKQQQPKKTKRNINNNNATTKGEKYYPLREKTQGVGSSRGRTGSGGGGGLGTFLLEDDDDDAEEASSMPPPRITIESKQRGGTISSKSNTSLSNTGGGGGGGGETSFLELAVVLPARHQQATTTTGTNEHHRNPSRRVTDPKDNKTGLMAFLKEQQQEQDSAILEETANQPKDGKGNRIFHKIRKPSVRKNKKGNARRPTRRLADDDENKDSVVKYFSCDDGEEVKIGVASRHRNCIKRAGSALICSPEIPDRAAAAANEYERTMNYSSCNDDDNDDDDEEERHNRRRGCTTRRRSLEVHCSPIPIHNPIKRINEQPSPAKDDLMCCTPRYLMFRKCKSRSSDKARDDERKILLKHHQDVDDDDYCSGGHDDSNRSSVGLEQFNSVSGFDERKVEQELEVEHIVHDVRSSDSSLEKNCDKEDDISRSDKKLEKVGGSAQKNPQELSVELLNDDRGSDASSSVNNDEKQDTIDVCYDQVEVGAPVPWEPFVPLAASPTEDHHQSIGNSSPEKKPSTTGAEDEISTLGEIPNSAVNKKTLTKTIDPPRGSTPGEKATPGGPPVKEIEIPVLFVVETKKTSAGEELENGTRNNNDNEVSSRATKDTYLKSEQQDGGNLRRSTRAVNQPDRYDKTDWNKGTKKAHGDTENSQSEDLNVDSATKHMQRQSLGIETSSADSDLPTPLFKPIKQKSKSRRTTEVPEAYCSTTSDEGDLSGNVYSEMDIDIKKKPYDLKAPPRNNKPIAEGDASRKESDSRLHRPHRRRNEPDRLGYYGDLEEDSNESLSPKITKPKGTAAAKRTVRVASKKVPFSDRKNIMNEVAEDGWSANDVIKLKEAHRKCDPTSFSFWSLVAARVGGEKSPTDCRNKWFSLVATPMLKTTGATREKGTTKNQNRPNSHVEAMDEDEDDLFNATPFREIEKPAVARRKSHFDLGSAIKVQVDDSNAFFADDDDDDDSFYGNMVNVGNPLSMAYPKTYMNALRREMARAGPNKGKKGGNPKQPTGLPLKSKNIAEAYYDGDADLNVRLSPGGTLKLKCDSDFEDEDMYYDENNDYSDEI